MMKVGSTVAVVILAVVATVSSTPIDPLKRARSTSSSLIPFPRVGRSVPEDAPRLYFGQKRTVLRGQDSLLPLADDEHAKAKRQRLIPFPRIGKRQALIPFPRTGKRSQAPAVASAPADEDVVRLANGLTLYRDRETGALKVAGPGQKDNDFDRLPEAYRKGKDSDTEETYALLVPAIRNLLQILEREEQMV